jgi:hypothetical protein
MKSSWLVTGLAVAVACGAAVVLLRDRKGSYSTGPTPDMVREAVPEAPPRRTDPAPAAPAEVAQAAEEATAKTPPEVPAAPSAEPTPEPVTPAPTPKPTVAPPPAPTVNADRPAAPPSQPKPQKRAQKPNKNGSPPAERPLAREALALVGADPVAETFWVEAINDPTRSSHERKDLIEDLNEEGFDDPKNLTLDDLPLIERRIALIEQLAPQAMDDANFAAFAEAYKDLVNMYARVAGR